MHIVNLRFFAITLALLCNGYAVADWPTYMHDAMRSGVTDESLALPLHETWVYTAQNPPRPAWPAPAKQDFWHEIPKLHPVVTYDRAYHAAVAGGKLYFGSSSDDQVYCLDAETGETLWTFYAEAPIRLAPAMYGGNVYFSSDDGFVYCLDGANGTLRWKFRPPFEERRIPGNGRLVSEAPARAGLVVDKDTVYFFSGLFPSVGVFRGALRADSGEPFWCDKADGISPQGYVLASSTRLFVPTGRTNPAVFDRETGKTCGQVDSPGGAFAVLAEDTLVSGPGRRSGDTLQFSDPESKASIATAPGVRMVVKGSMAYIQSLDTLMALDRPAFLALGRQRTAKEAELDKAQRALDTAKGKLDLAAMAAEKAKAEIIQTSIDALDQAMEACYQWRIATEHPYALVLAGDVLFAGGEGDVAAFSAADGNQLWNTAIPGRAYGLSVSGGKLYVSTDQGTIHCFGATAVKEPNRLTFMADAAAYSTGGGDSVWEKAAERILQSTGITEGYGLVIGCGEGRLLYELAQRSKLSIIGIENDADKIETARRALTKCGLYGTRVTVQSWNGTALPYTTYMMNLVAAGETFTFENSVSAAEVFRVLRPYGGTACMGFPDGLSPAPDESALKHWAGGAGMPPSISAQEGRWAVFRREEAPGAGEWTQLYADSGHTACSMDQLTGPMTIQWFGEPGPRDMIDRHHRPMSSLFKKGRLFIPGNDVVMCVDGYNGAPLWQTPIPEMRRVGAMKDNGQMLLTEDYLHVAVKGECWALSVANGERVSAHAIPEAGGEAFDWGYLDTAGDILIGSAEATDASFDLLSKDLVNTLEGDFRPVVISKYLFGVDRMTGERRWIYRNGSIMNSTILSSEGRIFFVESANDVAMNAKAGRIRIDAFCREGLRLTALDQKTGEKIWQRPVTFPFQHIMYLNGQNGVLLATGSYNKTLEVFYSLFGFDMATGEDLWQTEFRAMNNKCTEYAEIGGSHGEQWQHPVLINGTIYQRPYAFDLRTGGKKDYMARRGGHGCGGLTGSVHYLYGRGDNPRMYPLDETETDGIQLTEVSRPGCWLNIIPAGGIIMVPESSSGCTCGYAIQASFGFIPRALLAKVN